MLQCAERVQYSQRLPVLAQGCGGIRCFAILWCFRSTVRHSLLLDVRGQSVRRERIAQPRGICRIIRLGAPIARFLELDRLGRPSLRPGRVFPDAVHRLFRGSVVGAGDCVAGGRFAESAVFPGPGVDGGGAGSLDAVAHAAADRRRDPRGGFHVGSGSGCPQRVWLGGRRSGSAWGTTRWPVSSMRRRWK